MHAASTNLCAVGVEQETGGVRLSLLAARALMSVLVVPSTLSCPVPCPLLACGADHCRCEMFVGVRLRQAGNAQSAGTGLECRPLACT